MLNSEKINELRQRKMNCLVAKNLHKNRAESLHQLSVAADVLALAVPAAYLSVRYIFKQTSWMEPVEAIGELLAALLLVVTIVKLSYGWQERAEKHSKLIGENIGFIALIDHLLAHKDTLTDEDVNFFLLGADRDDSDEEALGKVKDREMRNAYREALKEIDPGADKQFVRVVLLLGITNLENVKSAAVLQ